MTAAHIGMANAWFCLSSFYIRPHDAMPKMKAAALRALEIDPGSADAHTALGNVALFYEWQWAVAEKHFQNAIRLDAASSATHRRYADYLVSQRRFDEALEESGKSVELDPFSLATRAAFLLTLVTLSRNDEALQETTTGSQCRAEVRAGLCTPGTGSLW
jgi:Tfp pilus assembly protein PilF